ncbi:hypothetical protein D9757_007626 [Collybiopsis confluens]|uniref:Major facilitator superfamily (MFS) profile domain-containing protein n=1 Tax=Collybiopsis confluens TaxID=2823264 RepID=A0A8H5H992_9AGAR|nr:hypothetical protein D9757_007626 [Collybiopsis confluens]
MEAEAAPLLVPESNPNFYSKNQNQTRDLPRIIRIILPTGIGIFLYAFDSTLIPASYAVIGSDFNQLQRTGWIATAYMVMLASIQPLYGKLSDIFGRKSCLLFAYSIYALGCLGCGLSSTFLELVAARALTGVGGAGMITLVSILVADLVPLRMLGTWIGALNVIFVLGQAAGSPVGGVLADGPGWRWSFLLQVPLLLFGVLSVMTTMKTPERQSQNQSILAKFRRIDFTSALLLVLGIISLLIGLDRAGNVAWLDALTIGALLIFLIACAALWIVELKIAKEPFAPCHIFTHKGLIASYMCDFFSTCSHACLMFFLPLFFQAVQSQTAAHAGTALVPAAIGATIGTLVGGWLVQKSGKFWWPAVSAYSIQALGSLAVTLIVYIKCANTGIVAAYAITSFGSGFGTTVTLVAIVASAGRRSQAIATAVSFLFKSTGGVIGIVIGGTIIQNSLRSMLRRRLDSENVDIEKIVYSVRASLTYIDTLPFAVQAIVRSTYRDAVIFACVFATVAAVGGVLSALRVIEVPVIQDRTEEEEIPEQ